MGHNGNNGNGNFEIGDLEFRKVKDGYDEAQVDSYINELIAQRDDLIHRTEHLSSLTALAERTVSEADKLVEEIKAKALDEAKVEAANIISQAEARAEQIENEAKRLQAEINDSANMLLGELLSGVENLKQKVSDFQDDKFGGSELVSTVESNEEKVSDVPDAPQDINQTEISDTAEKSTVSEQNPQNNEPRLNYELEILPPFEIIKIMEIVSFLENMPEVENTELIPCAEKPSITVLLREPIDLIEVLETIPVIENIEESQDQIYGGDDNIPKIHIRLSEKSVAQETA